MTSCDKFPENGWKDSEYVFSSTIRRVMCRSQNTPSMRKHNRIAEGYDRVIIVGYLHLPLSDSSQLWTKKYSNSKGMVITYLCRAAQQLFELFRTSWSSWVLFTLREKRQAIDCIIHVVYRARQPTSCFAKQVHNNDCKAILSKTSLYSFIYSQCNVKIIRSKQKSLIKVFFFVFILGFLTLNVLEVTKHLGLGG